MAEFDLPQLLAQVRYRSELSCFEGLEPLRRRLRKDEDGEALRSLEATFPGLEAPRNADIAFAMSERYRDLGDLAGIQRLVAAGDAAVKRFTLNALWDPGTPALGRGIVALVLEATDHPDAQVRMEVCWVLMNHAGYGIDVTDGVEPLRRLLSDANAAARHQAAYAIGHLAKKGRYNLSAHVADLRRNLLDPDRDVRTAAAWALWQLSRKRYELAVAVPDLLALLSLRDDVGDQCQNAVGALLHHARKSREHTEAVVSAMVNADLDFENRTIRRLQEELQSPIS